MKELMLEARVENLDQVLDFVNAFLERTGAPMKAVMQVDVAVEEIFVNIAHYAYTSEIGNATIEVAEGDEPGVVDITFRDAGVPYNPLEKPDPDVTLPVEERPIGGLGVFMVKKMMDGVRYFYHNGENVLVLSKKVMVE